ncbi:glucosylglycerol-phosphate synthase [Sphingobacterium thalpophilum]|uniref:Glucosylglycerol-phosphate synthase n=1 Tax=Sphingobacterium thalpophilum TaxID=259 RepID=A0A4U9VQQ6_9SPHI|nr:glucosylglycerol-phosphate synthase [Sphingobacterium thalpophilum]VTR49706.1 Glucosylglycerol-phosphate synthase [Sphingobacterium thalpophilum]
MLLATDLDGTFLGGKMEDRLRLYRLIKANRDIQLVFVTGRGLESVLPLLSDPLIPVPDFIIADVGATVVNGHTLEAIEPLQSEIEEKWPKTYAIRSELEEIPQLSYQHVPQQRRSSFYYESDVDRERVQQVADKYDCDIITSADRYLDLLPKGVNKGTTLRTLIEFLNIPADQVMVAGDTLNDLALFQIGFNGVAVGKSESSLLDAINELDTAYRAEAAGAGGILEYMATHSPFQQLIRSERKTSPKGKPKKSGQLVMVYHRLPFEKESINGKTVRVAPKSPNGIIPSLLGLFEKGRSGLWIGEEALQEDGNAVPNQLVDETRYPNLVASTISLSKEDIDQFYRVFSKEAFWPTIFSFVDKAKFNHEDWDHYLHINRLFADRVAREADEGALVWIHEYNLWMVPSFLKTMRPDLKIGFFHHTAFPAADIFNIIPWRKEIIGSLLLCDFISFHIPRYVENFVDVIRSHTPFKVVKKVGVANQFLTYSCALGVDQMTKVIEVDGRQIRLGAQPVGVNRDHIQHILNDGGIRDDIEQLKAMKVESGITRIISVERLDYVKGPLEKIQAFGEFLEEYPEFRGKIELVNVCTPPSQGMTIYDEIRDQVNQAVGEINGKFATMNWNPIQYFYRALPFEEVVKQYALSDIAWITPLRDGLNLVAKEYIATHGLLDTSGILVLSEFAGASVELPYAILTNPYDRKSMKESLLKALVMEPGEAQLRARRLYEHIEHYDIHFWGRDFVNELEKSVKQR